jgi:hypothetical protein
MVNSSVIELLFVMINNACCIFLILSPEMGTPLPRNAARRSLALGHEDTWDTERWFWLEVLDHSCLLLFAFEIVAGTIVYGFRCSGGWWRHTMWNKIDAVILFIEILEFASSYSWLLGITFRPLRICRCANTSCDTDITLPQVLLRVPFLAVANACKNRNMHATRDQCPVP